MRRSHIAVLAAAMALAPAAFAQTDPGPRNGPPNAGRPLPGLNANEIAVFNEGVRRFLEKDSVSGTEPGAPGAGLGPRFNANSCAACHAYPSAGGSSPKLNPQIAIATEYGATNKIPSFITQNGPVRVARYIQGPNGPDGGVHDLFTITGRSDAAGCSIVQPNFDAALAINNVIFRIPTPVYGAGLIEAIPDSAIVANQLANVALKQSLGIGGRPNHSGNDGTITRFGWKAQNKSLTIFGGEAYNVEQGVTNELFPNERDETPGCATNSTPEDHANYTVGSAVAAMSDVQGFAAFMKMLAPPDPAPAPANPSVVNGRNVFGQIGCALCHTQSLTTGNSSTPALANKQVNLYSDLLLHNMGRGLVDGITQGEALPGDWRTAPLWGLGQRVFFLHDGRTSDLGQAIQAHASAQSEANGVVAAYNALPAQAKQDLLNFLRSL